MAGQSPFAQSISGLAEQEQPDSTTIETTIAPEGTTVETTEAPEGVTTETTEAPSGEEQAELTIIDELKAQYGVEDVLENSVEGLNALIEKVTTKAKADAIKAKLEANPVLSQLDAHLAAGKSLESFFQVKQIEAQKIEVPKLTGDEKADAENKAYYKDVMRANYKATGLSDKQINRIIESSELEGTLYEDASEAAGDWNRRTEAQVAQVTQQEEQDRLAAIEADKKIMAEIDSTLTAGTLNGAVIPVDDRVAMKKFTLEMNEQGLTARDIAFSKLSLEKQLLIDYLVFKDFNIKGLTMAPSKSADLNSLRKPNPLNGTNGSGGNNSADQGPLPERIRTLDFKQLNGQIPVL